ncbi:putative quinol monooxygenase [Alisedimentitalea sp. MJ-SS2]|uniref:putative quinol monooxygenase n=1 Tax=Aliisedimentitalea sp. MJ-SS2 TaxID=3049795 RepID=UPI00290ED958|nr:putative quinol monooxygenase [Alisedimentitalea sp. MJ-SS2]MDU8926069.1 putative quinol monooxygenase [Alisedimentitalea sp. MJ-SS2]
MGIVHVLAVLTTKPGMRERALEAFQANVPNVLVEDGCIEYQAVVDLDGAGPMQTPMGSDSFVVIEKWESMEALAAHAAAPHMKAYGKATADMMADRKIHILTEA